LREELSDVAITRARISTEVPKQANAQRLFRCFLRTGNLATELPFGPFAFLAQNRPQHREGIFAFDSEIDHPMAVINACNNG
jgi:hypothetical protein